MNQKINNKLFTLFNLITINNEITYPGNKCEYCVTERIFNSKIKFFIATPDDIDYIFYVNTDGDQFNIFECHDKNIYIINLYLLLRIFIIHERIEKQKINEQHVQ